MINNGATLRRVSILVDELTNAENRQKTMIERQHRLRSLTLKFDVEVVALAGGYTVSTLTQYLRVKYPTNIGEESVTQAERILKQI